MKKLLLSSMACAMASVALAQTTDDVLGIGTTTVFDAKEDTTQVTTVRDIVELQEMVTSSNSNSVHFSKVWGRNTYFNLGWNTTEMKSASPINSGFDEIHNGIVPNFKSDWGGSITLGHSYKLHKRAIANILQFNIDYTYINLNVNHFKAEPGAKLFNSANTWTETDKDGDSEERQFLPWNVEKIEGNYSMELGPSLTIAPFTYINVKGLHYLKINAYYHIGYNISFMWMNSKSSQDANFIKKDEYINQNRFYEMENNLKINFGHGLTQTFGVNLSWKTIGIGWETRSYKDEYQSLTSGVFGKGKYKYNNSNSRIYLTFRY